MLPKIFAYVEITRPLNLLLAILSIFLGALVSGTIHPITKVFFACISGSFIMAGGNVLNDFFDFEIDRINKPNRVLPSGKMSPAQALFWAFFLFVAGLNLSLLIHWQAFGIAVLAVFLLILYAWQFKKTVLWGNILVSALSALAFFYGGLAVGKSEAALIPALFALLFHLGREIIKDLEDQPGDQAQGLRTLPIQYGTRVALLWVTLIFGLLILLTFLPYGLHIYGKAYLWTVLPGVDLVLLIVIFILWLRPKPHIFNRLAFILKYDMFLGLLAIFLGNYEKVDLIF